MKKALQTLKKWTIAQEMTKIVAYSISWLSSVLFILSNAKLSLNSLMWRFYGLYDNAVVWKTRHSLNATSSFLSNLFTMRQNKTLSLLQLYCPFSDVVKIQALKILAKFLRYSLTSFDSNITKSCWKVHHMNCNKILSKILQKTFDENNLSY